MGYHVDPAKKSAQQETEYKHKDDIHNRELTGQVFDIKETCRLIP